MNKHTTEPRFEFRVFGQHIGRTIASRLAGCPVEAYDEGVEWYLIAAANQEYNIKLRADQLDVKLLMRRQMGLERWHPYLCLSFPLTTAFLHEFFFAWLDLAPPYLRRDQYTFSQWWQELILPLDQVCVVQVHKQRQHFKIDDCQVEITNLIINNQHQTQTVAVEAANPDTVQKMIEHFHLHTWENTNYLLGLWPWANQGALLPQREVPQHEVPQREVAQREVISEEKRRARVHPALRIAV